MLSRVRRQRIPSHFDSDQGKVLPPSRKPCERPYLGSQPSANRGQTIDFDGYNPWGKILDTVFDTFVENPIDTVEDVLTLDDSLQLSRPSARELLVVTPGQWACYRLHCFWQAELQALHAAAMMDLKIGADHRAKIMELVCLINARLWIGHFEVSEDDLVPVFRHGLLLRGQDRVARAQVEDLMEVAIGECDRFYPAFQLVLLADHAPKQALEAALIETVGEA